jgi:hypothetical protein
MHPHTRRRRTHASEARAEARRHARMRIGCRHALYVHDTPVQNVLKLAMMECEEGGRLRGCVRVRAEGRIASDSDARPRPRAPTAAALTSMAPTHQSFTDSQLPSMRRSKCARSAVAAATRTRRAASSSPLGRAPLKVRCSRCSVMQRPANEPMLSSTR